MASSTFSVQASYAPSPLVHLTVSHWATASHSPLFHPRDHVDLHSEPNVLSLILSGPDCSQRLVEPSGICGNSRNAPTFSPASLMYQVLPADGKIFGGSGRGAYARYQFSLPVSGKIISVQVETGFFSTHIPFLFTSFFGIFFKSFLNLSWDWFRTYFSRSDFSKSMLTVGFCYTSQI